MLKRAIVSRFTANLGKAYSTHNAVLLKVLAQSEGDILELGGGPYSTPLLHWYCKNTNRKLITYEDDEKYYTLEREFQSKLHRVKFIKSWDEVDIKKHRGLVFIDHGGKMNGEGEFGSRRGFDAIRFKDSADYVILHDTEKPDYYGYDLLDKNFKYRFDWKECRPWTSVFSNFKDLSWLKN